ncbi:MAG: hypothetical protein PWP23_551, partial [Candidatus Sumerlaeota bacterium]|nr:hypothetical protein [Candidatus Sumerlaeota bacterium]
FPTVFTKGHGTKAPSRIGRLLGSKNQGIAQRFLTGEIDEDGVGFYSPRYEIATSGRIFEQGVGVQGCPRELRKALLELPPEYDLQHYDIVSSQLVCLLQQIRLAKRLDARFNVSTKWIEKYLTIDKAKRLLATEAGLIHAGMNEEELEKGTGIWKKCLYGLLFGSKLEEDWGAWKALRDYAPNNLEQTLAQVKKVLGPLERILNKWRNWLARHLVKGETWEEESRFHGPLLGARKVKRPGEHILKVSNACGCIREFRLDSKGRLPKTAGRKVAAHIIQGMESAAIHWLTILPTMRPQFNYRVIANIHDGVITLGEIPKEAWSEACHRAGLEGAGLEHKAL